MERMKEERLKYYMHKKITSQIGENLAGNFKIIFRDEMSGRSVSVPTNRFPNL